MFTNIESAIKKRALLVFLIIHLGLGLGICALSRQTLQAGWDLTTNFLLASVFFLYGGFVLGILFILLPLLPWLKRAQKVETWTDRIVRDLPIILEHLPKLVAIIQSMVLIWNEAKTGKQSSVEIPEE